MDAFYYDLALSGLTYVLLIYLAFRLMKKRKKGGKGGGDDQGFGPPKIDLPPGVLWPDDPVLEEQKEEVLL